jgi:NUMOD4 motif/HNH endonuclease
MAKVKWKPIPGWDELYEVSDDGRVRSLDRTIIVPNPHGVLAPREYKGRDLQLFATGKGYPSVKLSRPGQRPVTVYVHEAVMTAFVGPRPADFETCHGNGIPSDNRLCNLRYDTRKANAQDRVRHQKERT